MATSKLMRLLAVLGVSALFAVGCGDDDGGAATPPAPVPAGSADPVDDDGLDDEARHDAEDLESDDAGGSEAEAHGAGVSGGSSLAGQDPCELVTAAEVAAFTGRSVGAPERETETLCRWPIADPGGWARLGIVDAVRYAELIDLGYVETAPGVAHDIVNGSVMGVVVMSGDVGVQVGSTLPVYVGADKSPGVDAHLRLAQTAVGRL